jgi:hypothetical protein
LLVNLIVLQHAIGHLSALARTTSSSSGHDGDDDTFVFMGGDIASHCGEFRPTEHVPLPSMISPNPLDPHFQTHSDPCPGHIFEKIHYKRRNDTPFYSIGTWPDGDPAAEDMSAAVDSQSKLKVLDAHPNQILVILAHDEHIGGVIDLFPKDINDWRQRGFGDKARWLFLGDFKQAVEAVDLLR